MEEACPADNNRQDSGVIRPLRKRGDNANGNRQQQAQQKCPLACLVLCMRRTTTAGSCREVSCMPHAPQRTLTQHGSGYTHCQSREPSASSLARCWWGDLGAWCACTHALLADAPVPGIYVGRRGDPTEDNPTCMSNNTTLPRIEEVCMFTPPAPACSVILSLSWSISRSASIPAQAGHCLTQRCCSHQSTDVRGHQSSKQLSCQHLSGSTDAPGKRLYASRGWRREGTMCVDICPGGSTLYVIAHIKHPGTFGANGKYCFLDRSGANTDPTNWMNGGNGFSIGRLPFLVRGATTCAAARPVATDATGSHIGLHHLCRQLLKARSWTPS
jgi:hypothetical protein